jgi:hypothetical protein
MRLVVALTVTFTVCDAQQIGLSPASVFSLSYQNLSAFQTKLDEQKATQDLPTLMIPNQLVSAREQGAGTGRENETTLIFSYLLMPGICWTNPFCLRLNSCESPRAPPLMDPPISC